MAQAISRIGTIGVETDRPAKRSFLRFVWFPIALLLALSAGGLTGVLGSYYLNNSHYSTEVSALATYRPPQVTTIYADDGETILAEFALEKRIPIKEQDIPKNVEDALISVEDYRFYKHIGIDPYRILGATFKKLTNPGKIEGASTITQQLAKNLFLYRDQTYTRKINEWMVALQIERLYTKRQILEMYMNYMFLGAGSYGFEAGARTYFAKPLKDLNLEEAALLAAILKSPEYSPTRNMEKAKERRDIVLDQMAKYDKISPAEASEAKAKPIKLADTAFYQSLPKSTAWDYPVEEVRKYLEEKYTTRIAQGGLKVYTTINVDAQKLATKAVREGLRRYDQYRGWRSDYQNVLLDENEQPITDEKEIARKLNSFKHADWYGDEYEKGEFIKGVVMKIDPAKDEATIRFGRYEAVVTAKDMGRSGKKPKDELKVGFLPEFEVKEVDEDGSKLKVTLQQVPEVQSSIVSLNAHTGEIAAMVGGYDYHTSKFNNATQGLRQTGSAYKPFIYTAAVEWGMTPEVNVSGAPIRRGGWMPHNYDGSLSHPNVPMKVALAKSYNLAAVHLLDQVGVQTGAQMVRRFGITNPMSPSLPSALGASEASLLEMVSAYSAFPNKGVRVQPHLIRKVYSRDGSLLEESKGTTFKVTSEYVALTMVEMMQGVIKPGGTATGANASGHQLAGKTGTVNDQTDVWFIGYTPTYVTGVWMGNPERKESLGAGMTGGKGALPFFNAFMIPFMKDKVRESFPKAPAMPSDIKALAEQRKREELEKLEKAEQEGKKIIVTYNPVATKPSSKRRSDESSGEGDEVSTDSTITTPTDTTTPETNPVPGVTPRTSDDLPKPNPKPPVPVPPVKKPDVPAADKPKSEAPKRKGKKGEDDN
ncbi:MAG: PBP1A family penicillin-binding protein [Acidobacteria bacterium]|jgi:penicillin-binding protein 1A|nr:PBP1A family penicillin-binding protein [Acidobacteriota bacterium]